METGKFKVIAVLELITALGIILFWIGFFTVGLAPENPPQCYFAYEHSFPLPDILMSIAMIAGGILLLKGKASGRMLTLACSGGLVFLGLLDFSFNIQNGIYSLTTMDMILNGFINIWCVGFGAAIYLKLSN
jgi:hypothetical protein